MLVKVKQQKPLFSQLLILQILREPNLNDLKIIDIAFIDTQYVIKIKPVNLNLFIEKLNSFSQMEEEEFTTFSFYSIS